MRPFLLFSTKFGSARGLAQALRDASARPWPDANGDFYAVRTLENWYYAYQKQGFDGLMAKPRADRGARRVLDEKTVARILEQVTQNPKIQVAVLYAHWRAQDPSRPLPFLSAVYDLLPHFAKQSVTYAVAVSP